MRRPSPRWPLIILLTLAALTASLSSAAAQTCSRYTWEETTTTHFNFVYQARVPLGPDIAAQYGARLDAEYTRLANLFQTSLPTPLTVRLYPLGTDYTCLNALAPTIPTGQTHSHIGAREIALIAQYITADPDTWEQQGFETLRHELAILFVQHLTGGKVPPGLELGLGLYAEDPALTFEHYQTLAPAPPAPSATWRGLWEAPDLIATPNMRLQATSIVAYLVDVYGWDTFVAYLSTLRTAESYRTALLEVYQTEFGDLEDQWQRYYPYYFEGRWRTNFLHEFSLTSYEQLLAAGAYQAASDGLTRLLALLTQRGDQPALLAQAQTLLANATTGLEADALARQAHQAYQENDYAATLTFAAQALEKYAPLQDTRNQATLQTLQARAEEILTLRAELDTLQSALTTAAAPRLLEIAPHLGELGDPEGQRHAEQLLEQINAQRQAQAQTFALAGAGLGLGLLIVRGFLTRTKTPPEVSVQY
jgi:hypothetical protein